MKYKHFKQALLFKVGSFLYFCIQAFDQLVYIFYCSRHFDEVHTKCCYDKNLFREIFLFAGWTMNGNLAVMGFTQGLNILLNMFFGPAVNAARGIAVQVQGICQQFCGNFQMALNPQLTKSYAQGDLCMMHGLLIKSSKFSFFIMFFIAMPLMFEANLVLKAWLGVVPDHTVDFLRLILIVGLLYTLSNPIIVSVHATGRLKKFQLIEGSMLLMIVPIAYVCLKLGGIRPEYVFVVHILVEICTQFARLRIVLPMINLDLGDYFRKVVQARIYHRNEHWHCFYFTFKGLAGLESGMMGAKPHYHYISDKSGISREELNKRISECDMPSSKVHIIIERHQ